jgi:hypothetical protein
MGLLLSPPVVGAQGSAPATGTIPADTIPRDSMPRVTRVLRTFVDNDFFALRDSLTATDYGYTHGMGISAQWADAPTWLRRLAGGAPGCSRSAARQTGCLMLTVGLRQAIFTPENNQAYRVPGQRPHAAYLGASSTVTRVSRHVVRTLALDVGSTGRPALAEPVQRAVHAIIREDRPLGWSNQLEARLNIEARYAERYQADLAIGGALLRSRAQWGAAVGTMSRSAAAGAEVQVANHHRRRVWAPDDGGTALPLGPYLLGGLQQEIVWRDVLIEGYSGGQPTTSVRVPDVWQTTVGLGWRFPGASLEYRHVRRGRQYRRQAGPHAYGAIAFNLYRR